MWSIIMENRIYESEACTDG
uniref:Uncharacterized protein n=1 Tax=Anguilla anguilla TaxID=7936 RepID=A0A0E9SZW0_ANGAN